MILGICGSPRNKTSKYILDKTLNSLKELGHDTESFELRGKDIKPCQHCDYCIKNKKCIIDDDMQDLYPLILDADGIVIISPVHCGGVSSYIKMVMERTRALEAISLDVLKGKVGMGVAIGGDRVGGQELALQEIINFYIIHNMIPVGGGSFGANLGSCFWSKDTLDGVKSDEYGFETLDKTLNIFNYYLTKV